MQYFKFPTLSSLVDFLKVEFEFDRGQFIDYYHRNALFCRCRYVSFYLLVKNHPVYHYRKRVNVRYLSNGFWSCGVSK